MEKEEYWDIFKASGRIEDYLKYAGCLPVDEERKEERRLNHAGNGSYDGNDSQGRADW